MHRPGDGILASIDALAEVNSQYLSQQNDSLWYSAALLVIFFVCAPVLFAALLSTQSFLRRRFRRRRNLALLAATVLLVPLTAGVALQTAYAYRNLQVAEQQAFTHLQALWQARSLAVDANGNESLSLIARGNGASFDQAFKSETSQLVDRPLSAAQVDEASRGRVHFGGLLADEIADARFPGEREAAIKALRAEQRFLEVDATVRARAASDHAGAVDVALGTRQGELAAAFSDLDSALSAVIEIDQRQFDNTMAAASPPLGLSLAIPLLSLGIALLVLRGLQPRIEEYRS
jgi:hypothetical protein